MRLLEILRGLASSKVDIGTTSTIERLPRADLRHPVQRVVITYTPATLCKNYWLPWRSQESTTIWILRVDCILHDGQVFRHHLAQETALKNALDYGYLKGMQWSLQKLKEQLERHIDEARG